LSQLPPTVAATVVALVADIPSLVALEWACEAVSTSKIVSAVIVSAVIVSTVIVSTVIVSTVIVSTMISSLSVTSAFQGGGVGGPWWGYPYGYGYGYGYGGNGNGNGYGYGYGYSSGSRVAELQRRLVRAGYYHGSIDGIMGSHTRRAIRAYERDHNMHAYGAIDQGLLFENRNKS
jgi:hypothetical protein